MKQEELRATTLRLEGLLCALEVIDGSDTHDRLHDSARYGVLAAMREAVDELDRAVELRTVIVATK